MNAPFCLLSSLVVAFLLDTACRPIQLPIHLPKEVVLTPPPNDMPTPVSTPDAVTARILQTGLDALAAGDDVMSIAALTETIELNPSFTSAYVYRAATYLRIGETEAGVADCDAALHFAPALTDILVMDWSFAAGVHPKRVDWRTTQQKVQHLVAGHLEERIALAIASPSMESIV